MPVQPLRVHTEWASSAKLVVYTSTPCQALVDTGSTITLVRPGMLPGTERAMPAGWEPTSIQLAAPAILITKEGRRAFALFTMAECGNEEGFRTSTACLKHQEGPRKSAELLLSQILSDESPAKPKDA